MSKSQRLVFLGVAAVIAVVAVVVLGSGNDEEEATTPSAVVETATPSPTSTPTDDDADPTPTPTPTPKPKPEIPTLSADDPKTIKVKQGDTVRFAVASDVDEEVHLHGYDQSKDVQAGKKAVMTVKADITGIFEIELEHSGTPVGELEVRP